MDNFKIICKNKNRTLKIEYVTYAEADITIPLDKNSVELRGEALRKYINEYIISQLPDVERVEPDLELAEKLGL